jgi:hypothetical protein
MAESDEQVESKASERLFEGDQNMDEADPDAPLSFGQGITCGCC